MHYSILSTFGCLIFLIILIILYNQKEKKKYIRHKIFTFVLVSGVLVLLSEIITTELFIETSYKSLPYASLRFHWAVGIIWITSIYLYIISFIDKSLTFKEVISKKKIKLSLIFLAILFIGYFFVPFSNVDPNDINYLPGLASYYGMAYVGLAVLFMFIYEQASPNRNRNTKVTLGILITCGILVVVLQVIFYNIATFAFCIVGVMYGIYTTAENPDLDLIDEFKELKDKMEVSSRAKTDVILNMSHDIRSPMNAIVNYSDELSKIEAINNDQISNDLNSILISGKNLLNIIGDVLDVASSDDVIVEEPYKLKELLDDLINITTTRIGSKHIKLESNLGANVPGILKGNPTKLYRIIMNILSNAAKYTEVGKIVVNISCTSESNSDIVILHISVSDTGFGIKEEDKPKIFSEFERLNDATTQNIEGTGLGLANTKKNVEKMGGKISFESTYGAGTTFFIDLPQKVSNDVKETQVKKDIKLKENLINCSNFTALIVDDDKLNINVISRLLQRYGFKVDYALSGDECITKIKADNHYDIIFLDILFSNENGLDILKVLKQLGKVYDIPPVIACTANVINKSKDTYIQNGFDEYLSKPVDIYELDRIVNKYFSKYII